MCIMAAGMMGMGATAATMANVGIGLSIAQGAMSHMQQRQSAKAQMRWQQQQYTQDMEYRGQLEEHQLTQYTENAERAHESASRNYSEIQKRIGQEADVAAMEIEEVRRQSRKLQSNTRATAAERGVDGPSGDYVLDAFAFTELKASENVRMEQEWRLDQMMAGMDEVEAQAVSRIESMNPQPVPLPSLPQPVEQPNPFATLLNIGANAFSIVGNFYTPSNIPGAATPQGPLNLARPSSQAMNPFGSNAWQQGGGGTWTQGPW